MHTRCLPYVELAYWLCSHFQLKTAEISQADYSKNRVTSGKVGHQVKWDI